MKRAIAAIIVVGTILAIALCCGAPARAQKAEKNDRSLMRKKLEYSQRILEGIATEDFDLIRQNAEAMQELARSKAFSSLTSTKYRAQFLLHPGDDETSDLLRLDARHRSCKLVRTG